MRKPNFYQTGIEILAGGMRIGSEEHPLYWAERDRYLYFADGFWYYRGNPEGPYPGWFRVTDPAFAKEIECELRNGRLK